MLVFDLETNGLLDTLDRIHCMVVSDGTERIKYRPEEVVEGVRKLQAAIMNDKPIAGHNVINFDIPAIQKIFPWFNVPKEKRHLVVDTLVLSRLIYTNLKDKDAGLLRSGRLPGKLFGSHSLKAWGYRLGEKKGTYAEDTEDAWAIFTDEMLDYNEQDVILTELLLEKLSGHAYSKKAVDIEHEAAWLLSQQERNGYPFNHDKAEKLEVELRSRAAVLSAELFKEVPPIPDKDFIPKRTDKKKGYVAGVPVKRFKDFNPNSRQQIEWILTKHFEYLPDNEELFDDDGNNRLKIDDITFKYIKNDDSCPEGLRKLAAIFEEYLMVTKRLGQLADGKQAWLKCLKDDGYIHGSVNPNGAVTGRATHSHPNVAQVPKCGSPYGKECRSLFTVPPGWYQAGVDASGLELRCLAHFMYPYDNGVYVDTVVNGDIHTMNQQAAGLPTRDNAKTFIYAFLYGAGDAKIGKIVNGTAKEGKKLKREFLKKTPAIAQVKKAIENALVADSDKGRVVKWNRKYLKGLDGRQLHVRSLHSALNMLLQSAGALICKRWIVRLEERLIERGLKHGWDGDFAFMVWCHDEVQVACRTGRIAEIVVEEAQKAMEDTRDYFNFRVPLGTEGKIGKNWAECH